MFKKLISAILIFVFTFLSAYPSTHALDLSSLSKSGSLLPTNRDYSPVLMTGMTVYPENPLRFDFIIDEGEGILNSESLQEESQKLINYFMATLTIPEEEMWVNLSPYESNRIIANGLGSTEMGRDMLAQDYMLKQITASLLHPEGDVGKKFWERIHSEIREETGEIDIPTNFFNKIWIVPQSVSVYVHENNVFVVNSRLKVLLEQDYLSLAASQGLDVNRIEKLQGKSKNIIGDKSADIIRKVILPIIEEEVNDGENFSNLRQIYSSMILATWYKKRIKESILGDVYFDKNKTKGFELGDKSFKDQIYGQYLQAFRQGAYDYIKEDYDPLTQNIVSRQYFSGGLKGVDMASLSEVRGSIPEDLLLQAERSHIKISVDGRLMSGDYDAAMVSEKESLNSGELFLLRNIWGQIEALQDQDVPEDDSRLKVLHDTAQSLLEPYERGIKSKVDSHEVLRVLQLNQLGNPTSERLSDMLREMKKEFSDVPPTVITLQETSEKWGEYNTAIEVANALGYGYQEFLFRNQENFREGTAILYPPSFEHVETYHYSTFEEEIMREIMLFGVKLRSKISGKELYVFTTHLSANLFAQEERKKQILFMKEHIKQIVPVGETVVFAGDFNYASDEEADTLGSLLEGFDDTFKAVNPFSRGVTTYRGYRNVKFPGKRPDFIYASGLKTLHSRVTLNKKAVSDHFGLLSDLIWSQDLGKNSSLMTENDKDRDLLNWFKSALSQGQINVELFYAFLTLQNYSGEAYDEVLSLAKNLPAMAFYLGMYAADMDVVRQCREIFDNVSREGKVRLLLDVLNPNVFKLLTEDSQLRVIKFSEDLVYSSEEFDRYEQSLVDYLNQSEPSRVSEEIRRVLQKNAELYLNILKKIPDETLVVIQAAGQGSRLNEGVVDPQLRLDKNTEKISGISQIQRHLNILAALGYKNILIVHNEWNKDRLEKDVKSVRAPPWMNIGFMDGSEKDWLENTAQALQGAQDKYKSVMFLAGESPIPIKNLAFLRFNPEDDLFLFAPDPNPLSKTFHKVTVNPHGRMVSYEVAPGNLVLAAFVSPVKDLMNYWFDSDHFLHDKSLENYISLVYQSPKTKAQVASELLDNINTHGDLEKLRADRFLNRELFARFKGEGSIYPKRLARAILIRNGYFYGDKDIRVVYAPFSFTTVWATHDKKFYIKSHLPVSPFRKDMFSGEHYQREKWFYENSFGIEKPHLVAYDDKLYTFITPSVNPREYPNLAQRIMNPLVGDTEDSLLNYVGQAMKLLVDLQQSEKVYGNPSTAINDLMEDVWFQVDQIAEVGFDVSRWKDSIRNVQRYIQESSMPMVLSHGDFGPGNILTPSDGMVLIDGEYVGDRFPKEKDVAAFLVRLLQISKEMNLRQAMSLDWRRKVMQTALGQFENFSGQKIDKIVLYFFMAQYFLKSAYDIISFREGDLISRFYLEAAERFLMRIDQSIRTQKRDFLSLNEIVSDVEVVFFEAEVYVNIWDHLRYGRVNAEAPPWGDSLGMNNVAEYFAAGFDQKILNGILSQMRKDKDWRVVKNVSRLIGDAEKNDQAMVADYGGIDFNAKHLQFLEYGQVTNIHFSFDCLKDLDLEGVIGLSPVIIGIVPVGDFKNLIGFSP